RENAPNQIANFLALYDLPLRDNTGYVPFCAAGAAYSAAMAYADLLGKEYRNRPLRVFKEILPDLEHWYYYPSPSCNDMYLVARGKHRWIGTTNKNRAMP